MKRTPKHLSVFFMTLAMSLCMSASVFAAETDNTQSTAAETATTEITTAASEAAATTTDTTSTEADNTVLKNETSSAKANVKSAGSAQEKALYTAGWNINASGISYYYYTNNKQELTPVTDGYVYLTSQTVTDGYTFAAGLYYFENGVLVTNAAGTANALVYRTAADGKLTSQGYYVISRKTCSVSNKTYKPASTFFTGQNAGKIYADGSLYTGYAYTANNVMYKVSNGTYGDKFTGVMTSKFVSISESTLKASNTYYYNKGELFTGIADRCYYKKGVFQSTHTGWKKWNDNIYYLKKGKAVTGWKYIKDYSGGKTKYKYYFNKNGSLVTDLFKKFGSSWKKKKMKIRTNLTTHNTTIYLYDAKKKAYVIPAKTMVCSTARDGVSTRVGNYSLSKGSARRWFIYKKSNPYHYYQWGVHIAGCSSWFHSSMYRTTSNRSLIGSLYNGLGTNQTTTCIRMQAANAKLVYDIAKTNHYYIPVQIYRSSNKGPFGRYTIKNTTGTISTSRKTDPTDPAFK